ncbi:coiled-coil domain-containing protein, partial [Rhodococcus aerolatus]
MTGRPTARSWRARTLHTAMGVLVVVALGAATAGTAEAVPPPPPNPSDSDIAAANGQVDSRAGQVGGLINELVSAQAQLQAISDEVATKKNLAVKALVDLQNAQDAASAAAGAVTTAQQALDGAGAAIELARTQLDRFAAGSYQQGSTVGSFTAFLGSASPEDVLDRAQLLNAVGEDQQGVMAELERARVRQANADAAARAAQQRRDAAAAAAASAKADADAAIATAR